MTLQQTIEIPANRMVRISPKVTRTEREHINKENAAAWVNPLKGRAKALGSKLSLDRFMEMQEADKKLELVIEV